MRAILHYLYDPLCGWCYAAERLVETVTQASPLRIELHGGGLFARTQLPAAMREHIRSSDARIAQLSGQVFGDAYLNGLLRDETTVYDSAPTISAIMAAQALQADSGLPMLQAIQHAHYRDGRRVVELATLVELAQSIGLAREAFLQAYETCATAELQPHLAATRQWMARVGAQGFPTFVLQKGEQFTVLPHAQYYGQAGDFAALVLETAHA
jgi:putative protein-disulfide isomerase